MQEYRVMWEIDIYANSSKEAAEEALRIQRDEDSIATVFEVKDENGCSQIIDLEDRFEFCTICECNEIDEDSPYIDGVGQVCNDCYNERIKNDCEE